MTEKELLELAQEKAKEEYEEDTGECWDEADKYEREDYVFSAYMTLMQNNNTK